MNISNAIENFLGETGGIKAQATMRAYGVGVKSLVEHLKTKGIEVSQPIENLTIEHLISYPAYLGKMAYSKKTIGLYTSAIRAFVNWLIINGSVDLSPRDSLRFKMAYKDANQRRQSKLPRFPQKEDVSRLRDAVRKMDEKSPRLERNIALVEFLSSTGCRNNEVCQLKIEKLNMKDRSAVVVGKGDKERVVFFSQEALDAMKTYWQVRGDSSPFSPVFSPHDKSHSGKKNAHMTTTTVRNIVKDVMNIAGVEKFSPHYFRHAFAIKMLKETGNLALVQDLLGHADPAATRVYAKIYAEDLRDAHHKVFG